MYHQRAQRIETMLAATHADLLRSVTDMVPPGPTAMFWRWALAPDTPQCATWLQLMGVRQLAALTVTLFEGLVPDTAWDGIVACAATMNTYLTYEVISDNVAIGCATPGDPAAEARRAVLRAFNTAMLARLAGDPVPAHVEAALMAAVDSASLSLADQSLTARQFRTLMAGFKQAHPTIERVDEDVSPLLIANINAGHRLLETITDPFRAELRAGLRARYAGVNRLLDDDDQTWEHRLTIGRDTILVHPVLAYYAAVLHAHCMPTEPIAFAELTSVLHQAALLVRLLNDAGTTLLEMPAGERAAQFRALRRRAGSPTETLDQVLEAAPDPTIWTRICKDLRFGEWNVALRSMGSRGVLAHLDDLEQQIAGLATVYATTQQAFAARSAHLHATPFGSRIAVLAERFVRFHQALYRQSFASAAGEYASAGHEPIERDHHRPESAAMEAVASGGATSDRAQPSC